MSSNVNTPNPCLLTPEEQINILAFLKKTIVRLGIIDLPTAPDTNPFGAIGLSPNLRINGALLDTIQDIQVASSPSFTALHLGSITYPTSIDAITSGAPILSFLATDAVGNPFWIGISANLVIGSNFDTVQNIQTTSTVRFGKLGIGAAVGGSNILEVNGPLDVGIGKLTINGSGLPIKSNNITLAGQGNALIVASGNAITQTGAITSITSFTTPNAACSFEIGGYLDVTAFTAGTISLLCDYVDPSGTARTLTIPLTALNGTIGTTIGALGDSHALVTSVQTSGANAIKIYTSVSIFTGTYNAYAWIKQIA